MQAEATAAHEAALVVNFIGARVEFQVLVDARVLALAAARHYFEEGEVEAQGHVPQDELDQRLQFE